VQQINNIYNLKKKETNIDILSINRQQVSIFILTIFPTSKEDSLKILFAS